MGEASGAKVHPSDKYKQDQDSLTPAERLETVKADPGETTTTTTTQGDRMSSIGSEPEEEEDDEEVDNALPFWSQRSTINPTSNGMAKWDKAIMTVLLYTAIVTPFEVAFLTPEFGAMFVVNRLVDCVFIVDIVFTFFLDPGIDESLKTNGVPDKSKIACSYLTSWFTIDVVSCIPFDLMSILMEGSALEDLKFLRVIRLFRLIKLVRLMRATRMFDRWEDSMAINFAALSLTKSCCMVALFSHWFACLWYITYYIEDAAENWITSGGFEEYNTFDSYIASWYFSVMTMSTIGYGDISPVTSAERIVACIMMLVGAGIYAYVVGSITSTVQTMEAGVRKYQELMDQLNQFLEENQVDTSLRVQARAYFRTRHQAGNLVDWRELLAEMSPDLREQIASQSHENWAGGSLYFWNCPDEFVGKAAALFKEVTFPKGEKILEIGQNVNEIYVIKRGMIACAGKILSKGCLFGEDVVLDGIKTGDQRSPHVAMAFTFVQLQSLDASELLELLEEFPSVMKTCERASLRARFKSHVYSYASAARALQSPPLGPIGVSPNRGLIEHYKWKLAWLRQDGARGAIFFKNIIKLQAAWRGAMGRKKALAMKNSLLVQLNRTMSRSVKQINSAIGGATGGSPTQLLPEPPANGVSADFMRQLVTSLDQVAQRLTVVEAKTDDSSMMVRLMERLDTIDSKLTGANRGPAITRVGSLVGNGPPPLPMAGPPLPLK